MASGMLADEALPTSLMLKYRLSSDSPAFAASCTTIVLLAWCGTISSMLSRSVSALPLGSGSALSSSIIWMR
jgi:hypothetical protein